MTTRRLFGLVLALTLFMSASVLWYLDGLADSYSLINTAQAPSAVGASEACIGRPLSDCAPRRRHLRTPNPVAETRLRHDFAPGAVLAASGWNPRAQGIESEREACMRLIETPAEG